MTGLDLKLRRVGARVKVQELAERMSVTPSRVSSLEGQAVVTDDAAAKYLDALATLATVPSQQQSAEATA